VDIEDTEKNAARSRWARLLRRPEGLVAQTRWLLTLLASASIVVALPGVVGAPSLLFGAAAILAYAGLVLVWISRYRSGRAPVFLGVLEAALIFATSVTTTDPAGVFVYMFSGLWLRALYGSTRGILLHTAFVTVALLGALAAFGFLPGRDEPPSSSIVAVLYSIPIMFLTVVVARNLVLSLFAREESQLRDAALGGLGHRLLGVADRDEIHRLAVGCARAICAATPGLRLLVVVMVEGRAVVVEAAGEMLRVPQTVPTSVLPAQGSETGAPPDVAPLIALTGVGTWVGVELGDEHEGWALIGARSRVPHEAVVAIRSVRNQVALALRNSDAHHDLATQATHDALTGLLNRAAFSVALETAIADPERQVALLFLDLDDFKIVNDGMGHSGGDELLRVVAARLRAAIRSGDLCARLGGDEFAVLLREVEGATTVAQRLVELIATPVSLMGRTAQVGASVGLAFATPLDLTGEELVQRADIAMYSAKAKGKNRVQVFDPALLQEDGRAQFEAELTAAAAAACEFVVHYQPIVRIVDGRCVAAEALVRWQHPSRGLLFPGEFIQTAERTGTIVGIGAFVMRQACAQVAGWSGSAGPLAVHVNVSVAQLTEPDIVETVRSCLTDNALEPHRLVLEITESMVLDSPAVRATLFTLAGLGVAIAIDDFGTGYSALSTLRSLPLDIVKIDKSFLEGGPTRAADEAVVEAIVQMAARLGLSVVAEGVERVDQQLFLRRVGAYAAQGFLYLRPAPAENFAAWLDEQDPARPASTGVVTPITRRRTDTA
jgi:diguanylate cyclase (GGDEF)-like protein